MQEQAGQVPRPGGEGEAQEIRREIDQTRAGMSGTAEAIGQQSLQGLFADLLRDMTTLVRQELALARTEVAEKATGVGKDAGLVVAGGVLGYTGLLAMVAAAVELLAAILPRWLSALLVGAALVGGGAGLAKKGLDALRQADLTPRQTVETVRETGQWAKDQL
jgi:hypothetical protein